MTILSNIERVGNFTSSKIVSLTSIGSRPMTPEELAEHKRLNPKSQKKNISDGFGATALTYISEVNMERRLGRSLTNESKAHPLVWGKLLEGIVASYLPFDYELCSDVTIVHPDIPHWSGSPDGVSPNTVNDIKCPLTLKSFCNLVDPIYQGFTGMDAMNAIRENHPDGEKYFWQLVSNSILVGMEYAELIVFVPYEAQLAEVKLLAEDQAGTYWITNADEMELPYLIEGGYYQNMNKIRFKVDQSDKDLLTNCVIEAGKLLR